MARTSPRSSSAHETNPALLTPSDLPQEATEALANCLNRLVADAFSLYLKTRNFHWHVSGPHFRDYHLLLDEQADQILASVDPLAERVRKLGRPTVRSVGQIMQLRRIADNESEFVTPLQMLCELMDDNKAMAHAMREAHELCDERDDVATASLLEVLIDESEKRLWFLFETARQADQGGH